MLFIGFLSHAAETQGELRSAPFPNFRHASRAPFRDISPRLATPHDDDIDMEPRRKEPTNISVGEQHIDMSINPRSIKPLPGRRRKSGKISGSENTEIVKLGTSHLEITSGRSRPNPDKVVISVEDVRDSMEPKPPEPPEPEQHVQNSLRNRRGSFDFELLSEVDDHENAPPSKSKSKGRVLDSSSQKGPPPDAISSDYGLDDANMFADDDFWEVLDRVEKEALEDGERLCTHSKSNHDGDECGYSQTLSTAVPTSSLAHDVIELQTDSDEEADKENTFVPMRHVRRKTENAFRGRSLTTSQDRDQSKTKGSVVVNPCDVIDISDSD